MKKKILLIAGLAFIASATFLVARGFRAAQIPHGSKNDCANCHVNPAGGGSRNSFGQEIGANHLSTPGSAGQVQWSAALAMLDSDGDGFTNGQELQDPQGSWMPGQALPGDPALVTNPGDPTDFPNTTAVDVLPGIAAGYLLDANYPNPFNPSTTIRFELREAGDVHLAVFNNIGERVRTLSEEFMESGVYSSTWNGRDDTGSLLQSGTYLYRLTVNGFSSTRRMVMLK